MSYNRTVRCSYCYKTGHNKTTCPVMLAEAEKDPNSYAAVKLGRIRAKKKATVRHCSYCHVPGHTKRTCPQKPIDAEKLNAGNRIWRAKVLESLTKAGIGVGTLLEVVNGRLNHITQPGDIMLVVDIAWDSIAVDNTSWEYKEKEHSVSYSLLSKVNQTNCGIAGIVTCFIQRTGAKKAFYLPQLEDENGTDLFYYSSRADIVVVSPSEPTPPDDWLICDDWAQKVM